MKYTFLALITGCFFAACSNPSPSNNAVKTAGTDSSAAPQDFFPVPDYIGGQVKIIDSLKLPISKTVTINNRPVLSAATDTELGELARQFREPDINDPALKKQYTQTSIADQSVPSITLIFSTVDTSLVIQKINVYIQPDPVKSDRVTGIYIEKHFNRNDTGYNQKLYWKTDKNMQIITEKKVKGNSLPMEQTKISWGY